MNYGHGYNPRNKYHAKKTDGFDSKKEKRRYEQLLLMERAGQVSDLKRQVPFLLIPAQREPDTRGPRGGTMKGKVIERAVQYIADFTYIKDGVVCVEDTKGVRTPEYIIKRKLMLQVYGIQIREV